MRFKTEYQIEMRSVSGRNRKKWVPATYPNRKAVGPIYDNLKEVEETLEALKNEWIDSLETTAHHTYNDGEISFKWTEYDITSVPIFRARERRITDWEPVVLGPCKEVYVVEDWELDKWIASFDKEEDRQDWVNKNVRYQYDPVFKEYGAFIKDENGEYTRQVSLYEW